MGETVRASSAMTQAQELTARAKRVYENERSRALHTFECLLYRQVIAQKQPRSNVNPEQYAIKEGYKAAEKRDELNATLKDSILTMLKSGIPLDFIQVLANDDQMNFTIKVWQLQTDKILNSEASTKSGESSLAA